MVFRLHTVKQEFGTAHSLTRLLEPQFTLYSEEARFTFSGYINSRNNTQCSTENPDIVRGDSSHDLEVQMSRRISERGVTEPIFGQNNKSQTLCKINFDTRSLNNDLTMLRSLHNDITTTHIANSSIHALADDSSERVIIPELRPTRSPDLKEH